LPEVLATLTTYARTVAVTRMIVVDSLLYPIVVMLFALLLFAGMVIFIVPGFDKIFKDFNMRLPLVTEWVLMIGRNPIPIFIPFVLALLGLVVAWAIMRRTSQGRRLWAWMLYGVPLLGTLVRAARLAAFADLLAV